MPNPTFQARSHFEAWQEEASYEGNPNVEGIRNPLVIKVLFFHCCGDVIEGVLTKIRRKLHDRVVYNFHVSSPKKYQDIQMYGHEVKFMDKVSGCYPINNSFEINFKILNIVICPI